MSSGEIRLERSLNRQLYLAPPLTNSLHAVSAKTARPQSCVPYVRTAAASCSLEIHAPSRCNRCRVARPVRVPVVQGSGTVGFLSTDTSEADSAGEVDHRSRGISGIRRSARTRLAPACRAAGGRSGAPYTRPMHSSLWAPWRMAYIRSLEGQADAAKASPPAGNPNFLAEYWAHPERDAEQHVVHRDARGMVLLNRYPYTNGHLRVALGEPRPPIERYAPADRAHFWRLMELAMDLCEHAFAPQGMNVGINLGKAAGAGLPEHLHGHVVPRWNGDTNFMTTVGGVRVMPQTLEDSYARLKAEIAND